MFQTLKQSANPAINQLFSNGRFDLLHAKDQLVLFTRSNQKELALVAINTGPEKQSVHVSLASAAILDELGGGNRLIPDANGDIELAIEGHSVGIFHNTCYESV